MNSDNNERSLIFASDDSFVYYIVNDNFNLDLNFYFNKIKYAVSESAIVLSFYEKDSE